MSLLATFFYLYYQIFVTLNLGIKMTLKKIGFIILSALALTLLILIIEINIYNDGNLNKMILNEILLWSLLKGLVISIAVHIGNSVFKKENK